MKTRDLMMFKMIYLVLVGHIVLGMTISAQQALWGGEDIVSPEVHEDHTVTLRLWAPHAQEVQISGDWMPIVDWVPVPERMTKDEKGLWTYRTEALASDLYGYAFLVDGLRCADPNNVYLIRDVATLINVFIVGGGKGDLYQVNDVAHGSVTRRWYDSPGNGQQRRITIYTPPNYEGGKDKYPVLYLLHGMGGDEEAWMALGRTAQILDNLIAQGKVEPMIVVMPNGNVAQEAAPGESSLGFYKPTLQLPNTMDGQFEETFLAVLEFVEANYRVKAEKGSRAIAGLSMGGYHALHISRYYPNAFDYVGLFSAAILPNKDVESKVYEDLEGTLVAQMKNGYKQYWMAIGEADFLYQANLEYRTKLDALGMPYTYVETGGGHTWTNWRVYLTEFSQLLFK